MTNLPPHFDDDVALEVAHEILPPAEIAAAVEHAAACPECDRRLRTAAGDRERLRARARVELGAGAPRTRARHTRPIVALLAAAVVAIVAAALLSTPRPRATSKPELRALPLPMNVEMVFLRGTAEESEIMRLEHGVEHYAAGDFAEAAADLQPPFVTGRLEPMRRLYRAACLLEAGRPDEAKVDLDAIANTPLPEPYGGWRDWARFEASGDAARADSVLRVLAASPDPLGSAARARLAQGAGTTP